MVKEILFLPLFMRVNNCSGYCSVRRKKIVMRRKNWPRPIFFLLETHLRLHGPSKVVRIKGYMENIVPRFNTRQFRENYRMLPKTFEILENRIGPILAGNASNKCIPVRTQLLASLWLLVTPDCFR